MIEELKFEHDACGFTNSTCHHNWVECLKGSQRISMSGGFTIDELKKIVSEAEKLKNRHRE